MENVETLKITNDDDALKLLADLHAGKINADGISLEWDNWPFVNVHVHGEQFDSTITPSLMNGFIELQKSIHRSYALVKYGDSGKRLTAEERKSLELVVRVTEGSSDLTALLEDTLKAFVEQLSDMESKHKLIAVLGISLMVAGCFSYANYLEVRKEERKMALEEAAIAENREVRIRELEQMQFMTQQETERLKIYLQVVNEEPALRAAQGLAYAAKTEILKGLASAESAEIQGKTLTGGMAEELKTNAPKKRTADTVVGNFWVSNVDSAKDDKYIIKFKRAADGLIIKASIPHDFTEENVELRDTIRDAEWSKTPVYCEFSVKRSGTRITSAELNFAEMRGVLAEE